MPEDSISAQEVLSLLHLLPCDFLLLFRYSYYTTKSIEKEGEMPASSKHKYSKTLAFPDTYYELIINLLQSVELFCAY